MMINFGPSENSVRLGLGTNWNITIKSFEGFQIYCELSALALLDYDTQRAAKSLYLR